METIRILRSVAALAVALCLGAAVAASGQDLVTIDPKGAKVEYEDARVRVVRLRIAPGESLPVHDRPRRVIIPLATSEVRSFRADGSSGIARSEAGKVVWSEPGKRSLTNLSAPVENIVVELKQAGERAKPRSEPPTPRPAGFLEDPFHHWGFENQYVRVYEVRLPPGATTEFEVHALDAVEVAISGGTVSSQAEGKPWSRPAKLAPGTVAFTGDARQPHRRRLRNDGPAEYHAVLVQLLP